MTQDSTFSSLSVPSATGTRDSLGPPLFPSFTILPSKSVPSFRHVTVERRRDLLPTGEPLRSEGRRARAVSSRLILRCRRRHSRL